MMEIMGYRARRDLAIRTWAVWRFTFSMTLALLQVRVFIQDRIVSIRQGESRPQKHADECVWFRSL